MGKIFTIEIEYAVYKYRVLVSVCGLSTEPVFHLQFMDSFLKDIFQTEHIWYTGIEGYKHCAIFEDEISDDMAEVIIEQIGKAIEEKLTRKTALIRRLFYGTYRKERD